MKKSGLVVDVNEKIQATNVKEESKGAFRAAAYHSYRTQIHLPQPIERV